MSTTQVPPVPPTIQSPFRSFGEYDIQESKYVIDNEGYWRRATDVERPDVNTKATLEAASRRCSKIMRGTVAATGEQNRVEMELHFEHTLYLAKKVMKHVRRQWDWIPLIGWIFGNIAAENVRKKFEPIVDQMQFYLQRRATHVLAAKDELLTTLGLKINPYRLTKIHAEIAVLAPEFIQTSVVDRREPVLPAAQGPRLPLQRPLPPMRQHVENLFTHGSEYGFHPTRLNFPAEAEDILSANGGHEMKGTRFVFWRKEDDTESFQIFVLAPQKTVVQKFSVAVYERGDKIQYDFGSYSGRFVPSITMTKRLPDFPISGESEQTKLHYIEHHLEGFCSRS